jgi:hypothetical protein
MYEDKDKLLETYERWLGFIEQRGVTTHMIINSTSDYRFAWSFDKNEVRKILTNKMVGKKLTFPIRPQKNNALADVRRYEK